jgi:ectonucleotide pyrophosphatase/phosphodiesterase family member 5
MKNKYQFLPVLLLLFTVSLTAQPYVIFISFDAFRWDYLNRGLTPNIEKIRSEGISALSLQPSFPSKTFPNHQSIITGMYPAHHGIIANNFLNPFDSTIYRMKDTTAVKDGRWYLGEAFWETAERQGIRTASYYWPGSEMEHLYRRPSISEHYNSNRNYEERVSGVIKWLTMPAEKRPHFITLYFELLDDAGHTFGPNSKSCDESLKKADELIGSLLLKLDEIKMKNDVNVIILSDHGMTEISEDRIINIENLLAEYKCRLGDEGPTMMVYPQKEQIHEVYNTLKKNEKNFHVYYREQIPSYYNFSDHPFISPIYLIAEKGWSLVTNRTRKDSYSSKGNHGYDNHELDMHGIFIAAGPNFKTGYRTGTIRNVDIYPLLCKLFNIIPRANIDGKLDNVEFLLR